jgi:hypothetical protein
MAMKDNAGLVKQYAMVNVQEYQIVATGATPESCESAYLQMLLENNTISADEGQTLTSQNSVTGVIAEIRTAVLDGNTYYFLRLEGEDVFYSISAAASTDVVILNVGDIVTINYAAAEGSEILSAYSVSRATVSTAPAMVVPEETPQENDRSEEPENDETVLEEAPPEQTLAGGTQDA